MLELGDVQDTTHNENATGIIQNSKINLKTSFESKEFMDDDAAVAEIHNPVSELSTNGRDYQGNIDTLISLGQSLRDSILVFRERLAELKQRAEEMADSRFTAGNLAKSINIKTEDALEAGDELRHPVYSDASEQLVKIRKEIKAIASFDGFLLGVHDKIDEFTQKTEFSLKQVAEVVNNIEDFAPRTISLR